MESETRSWFGYTTKPVLPVPEFVTPDWLRAKLGVANSTLREMHNWRGEIQTLSGFDEWPEDKPTLEDLIDLFPLGLRYPNFVRALTRQAVRSLAPGKRQGYILFRPFRATLDAAVRSGLPLRAWTEKDRLEALCNMGEFDLAFSLIFLVSHGIGFDPDYLQVANRYSADFAPILPFIEVAKNHLPARFDWDGEIVNLKGSAASPPIPVRRVDPVAMPSDEGAAAPALDVVTTWTVPDVNTAVDDRSTQVSSAIQTALEIKAAPSDPDLDFETRWAAAIEELVRVAKAAGPEPDRELLALVRRATASATLAYRGWEAARSRLVNGGDLASAAAALASNLQVDASTRPFALRPRSVRLPPREHTEMEEELSVLRVLSEDRRRLMADAQALMLEANLDRYDEIGLLRDHARDLTASATSRLTALLDRLDAAVATEVAQGGTVPRTDDTAEKYPLSAVPTKPTVPARQKEPKPEEFGLDDAGLEFVEELASEEAVSDDEFLAPTVVVPDEGPVRALIIDPIIERIERKLSELMRRFDVSLAYHLVRAARKSFPDYAFPFDDGELRLVAMAEHVNHAALQGSEILARTLENAFESAERLRADDIANSANDARQARLIALFGAAASLVLFHPHTSAGQILSGLRLADLDLDGALYQLRDTLVEASRLRVPLTPAMFRAATDAAAEDRHADECRDEILAKIESVGRLQFKFQLGTKIRMALVRSDGALGRLQDAVRGDADGGLEAAREFAANYADRGAIIQLFVAIEEAINRRRIQGIDGEARERLISNITELAGLCLAYVQARDAAPAMKVAGSRAMVQSLRDSLLRGLDQALPALHTREVDAAPLSAAAAAYAARCLERLRGALDGRLVPVGPYDHLVAVHGSLPWVAGLRFGRSWLPSPYEADTLVRRILQSDLTPETFRDARAFEDAIRARVGEDSFVAALLLMEQGPFRGIDQAVLDRMSDYVHFNMYTRRDKLTADIEEVRRAVDRIQRLGSLVGADDGQDLLSLLDRINPTEIPAFKEMGVRTEAEEEEAILDVAAAQSILDDVSIRVNHLMDRPTSELIARLDNLSGSGRASQEDARRVRHLVERGDLLTAGEYLDFITDGRELPAASSPNPRFRAFYPTVPDFIVKHGGGGPAMLREAILSGTNVGPLAFERVPEARREDTAKLFGDWLELRRRVQAGLHDTNSIVTLLGAFLDDFGFGSGNIIPEKEFTSARKKTYAASIRLRIQKDSESVLLPRFGSLTQGNYRVVVLAKMPTHAEIGLLCENAGAQGVILFVMEAVSKDRRQQLALFCAETQREMLVIDEAIVLFALSQGEFRPLTLLECAQPFSFGAPYRDYGNQAVPTEIFFGRENEFRKIVDPSGSCIVYGGRRLGKTALLQQIREKEDNPKAGTAVAFVSIYGLGKNALPSDIWASISRQLTSIFKEPAKTAASFTTIVEKWLEGDSRRRILALLDEADEFIRADAAQGFREFIPLQRLMDSTSRRFKFVLAGLHNVTRLVHTENPPLKQIASDPQRIGPLMGEELMDAELLVTRPLAALGFEFERREDVWRILSHCNYYPVLVQTFCKGLLDSLFKEVSLSKKVLFPITSEHVRRALENENISKEIGEMFNYTLKIDDRYDLIANIMAERALEDTAAGRVGQGMSSVEVVEAAARFWPSAFDQTHRLSVIEDLLDEMEGLGLLRRGPDEMWSLRSNAILRLLGNDTKIVTRLIEFMERPAPAPFEPRSMRRDLQILPVSKAASGHSCPLTLGQEHDLLVADPGGPRVSVHVIFGNALSDVGMVGTAMRDIDGSARRKTEVVAKFWPDVQAMLEDYRCIRAPAERTLFVADAQTPWDHGWISTVLRSRAVREGRLSLAFVGGPEHALRWVLGRSRAFPPAAVKIMPLQLWSVAMIDHHLGLISAPTATFSEELRRLTGGFNHPMSQAIGQNPGSASNLQARIEKLNERLLANPSVLADLGLIGPMRIVFERMQNWLDEEGCITPYEITEAVLPDTLGGEGLTGARIVEFGLLLSLLKAEVTHPGAGEDARRFSLNPLLLDALRSSPSAEAA